MDAEKELETLRRQVATIAERVIAEFAAIDATRHVVLALIATHPAPTKLLAQCRTPRQLPSHDPTVLQVISSPTYQNAYLGAHTLFAGEIEHAIDLMDAKGRPPH
mgnify:FL=1